MKISEIKNILDAQLFCGEEFVEREVFSAFGCDLMSDVLAFVEDQAVLLTGLVNCQVVRTAEMLDIKTIIFVRGKTPTEEMVKLANEYSMILMSTKNTLYTASGKLYSAGLIQGV